MKKYDIRVLYMTGDKSAYMSRRLNAAGFTTATGYYSFYDDDNNTVFTSPINLTIIERISG